MKTTRKLYILICGIALLSFGCGKDNANQSKSGAVSVIGFEPCTSGTPITGQKGYVLVTAANDTVVTFNLPLSIAQKIGPIPKFKTNFMFAPEVVVNTTLTYHSATRDEQINTVCLAIYNSPYINKQVVIDGTTN
jgi:hypothetical protein